MSIPGEYKYYCQVHADRGMIGTIIVAANTQNPPPLLRKPPPPPRQLSPPPQQRPPPPPRAGQKTIHEIKAGTDGGQFFFDPFILRIKPNDVVKWVGNTGFLHNVFFYNVPVGS